MSGWTGYKTLVRGGVALWLTTLAGCTVGPDYRLPAGAKVTAPAADGPFASAPSTPGVTPAEPPAAWWRLYQDPVLDRLVPEALAANTDLRAADANLERSSALLALARTSRQPQLGFTGGVERSQLSAEQYLFPGELPVFTLYDADFTASYDLDLFGRIRRGIEAAKASDEAAAAARDRVQITIAAEVTAAYVDICTTGDQLRVAEREVGLQQQSAAFTARLRAEGRATQLDATRAKGQVDEIRATIPALQARQQNDVFQLATLAGRPPATADKGLAACKAAPRLSQPIPLGDGAALLRRRPDVREAERALASATAEIGVATADLYPDVELEASVGSTGLTGSFLGKAANHWAVGPALSWQLNQNPARARIAAAKATQKARLAQFDGAVLSALREVEAALTRYSHDLQRQQDLRSARDEAASARADAHRLQEEGRSGALATLDADRTLAEADAALAGGRAQVAGDQVLLFLALGGGWQTDR